MCSVLERTLWGLSHMILSIPHEVGTIIILMITQLGYGRADTGTQVFLTSDPNPCCFP